jgi:predicted secreted protein
MRRWKALVVTLMVIRLSPDLTAPASAATVTVDESRSGSMVHLNVGDTLRIRLKAEAGPDYVWHVAQNNPSLLQPLVGAAAESGDRAPDSPKRQTLIFRAVGAGGAKLSLLYQNPGLRGVRALDMFQIMVLIDQGRRPKTILLSDGDNFEQITLNVGDTLVVRLSMNAGTGFSWSLGMNDDSVLRPLGPTTTEKTLNGLPGGRSLPDVPLPGREHRQQRTLPVLPAAVAGRRDSRRRRLQRVRRSPGRLRRSGE